MVVAFVLNQENDIIWQIISFAAGSEDDIQNKDLGPPDHLDAVKFERDGHLNVEFHQEIFLGEDKHHFRDLRTREEQLAKLEEIFHRLE